MAALLGFFVSVAGVILQAVATLNVTPYSLFWLYQPKTPKSLLK